MNREVTFGSIVKERRNNLGLTQAELGRRVGCAAITIRKIEADSLRPSVQIAEHLAVALNIPEAEQLAFVRLARTERDPSPLPTPQPIPAEIGQADLSGRAIRGFELGERIGTGGYGVVYRAVQSTVERDVAVKIILPKFANQPEFIRRFEAEAQLVARLEHPHIVPLYDYWREPSAAYLIMRLLRGGSLETLLKDGPLPHETILLLMEQLCAGLHTAHRAGVIHRDLKPANILLDEAGNAYLADFGIAKHIGNGNGSRANTTLEGTVIGSPAYISPEQILAEPVKPQTDIYSLGILLYEALTGQKPFKGPTPVAYIQQHLNEALPLLAAAKQTSEVSKTSEVFAPHPLPTALDIVIGRATAKELRDRYPDVQSLLADLRRALRPGSTVADLAAGHPDDTTPPHVAAMLELPDLENPYKGLRPFTEADAADFFGRQTLIQDLLARIGQTDDLARFLAVVGPSGSGKSSVVRAGLIPALRQGGLPNSDTWFITEMIPGPQPFAELESALMRVAVNPPADLRSQISTDERGLLHAVRQILPADPSVELLLVIDQFEEIFTLVEDEQIRQHFLASLVTAVLDSDSRLRVVITLRADFTHQPLQYVDFGELVRQRTEFVLPLTPDELEEAIVGPTKRAGLALESGLIQAIIRDIGDQPGMLPLLQYALTELFERRRGRLLTLTAYQESGGVLGALARRADEIYDDLDERQQQMAQQLFLRLVTLGEGTEDTRRRVLRSELTSLEDAGEQGRRGAGENATHYALRNTEHELISNPQSPISQVVDKFGRYRLLTFDHDPISRGPTVEVAHEALLREWDRLRGWLDDSRTDIRLQRQVAASATEWQAASRDESFLLRGTRLDQFAAWADETQLALTGDERAFIETSLSARETRRTEEEIRRQQELETAQKLAATEQQAAQRLRWLVAGLAIFLLAAVGLTVFAFNQQAIAEANQAEAESNLALSESQRLAAEANAILQGNGNAELAALLSLRAMNTAYTPQADIALQQASKRDYGRRLFLGHTSSVDGVAFSADGQFAVSGSNDKTARLWEVETGQAIHTLTGHTAGIRNVAYSPDGNYLLTGSIDKTARLWDAQTGRELFTLTGHTAEVNGVAFSPDSRYALTGGWEGTIRFWDVETGQEVRSLTEDEGIFEINISADGQYILTGNKATGKVRLSETATGLEAHHLTGLNTVGTNTITFSPDGRYALAGHENGGLYVWDLQQTEVEPRIFSGHTEWIHKVRVSPDGNYALSASHDGTTRLWDIQTGEEVRRFISTNHATSIAFSPDGQTMLVGEQDGNIRLWDVEPPPDPRTFGGHTDVVPDVEFSPDGRYALIASLDQTAKLWDIATGQELHVFRSHTDQVNSVAFSPDSRYALTGSSDNTARLWDLRETGQEIRVFRHPAEVFGVAFSLDGRYALTGSFDNAARLWDVETGQEVRVFTHPAAVFSVVFSPDGRYILTGSFFDRNARLWEVDTGREIRQFPGYAGFVNGLSFSPDGKTIITAAEETTSQLWEVETGQPLERFPGDVGQFSADGRFLLTGGLTTAYLWDRAAGEQLRTFEVANNLWTVELSPDGQFILIGGADQFARLWDTDYQRLVDSVCARVLRDFTDGERQKYSINDQQPTCLPSE